MLNILIISTRYADADRIRSVIRKHGERYALCGMSSNSVSGMSLVESLLPDVVVMPSMMTFWNASDLINSLTVRGFCPLFILLDDHGDTGSDLAHDAQVVAVLPQMSYSDKELLFALADAESKLARMAAPKEEAEQAQLIQHSIDVSGFVSGMLSRSAAKIQTEYGQLHVGNADCWVLMATPEVQEYSATLFLQIDRLGDLLEAFHEVLRSYGKAEVCIHHENNLCILLAAKEEPDWQELVQKLSDVLAPKRPERYSFQISDKALPGDAWPDACRELVSLAEKRFFYAPAYLQPKMLEAYKQYVTQDELLAALSELTLAAQNLDRARIQDALSQLEYLVSHSLSHAVYSTAFTQLAVIFNRMLHQFSLEAYERQLQFRSPDGAGLRQIFSHIRMRFLEFCKLAAASDKRPKSQLVVDVRNYIDQHIGQKITLAELAEHVHMNQSYLSRVFKEESGQSISEYIASRRVARAKQLLSGPYKIITIAEMSGFNDARYFSQVFRKHTGMTPQQYRKEQL